jgi:predicted nucleic acid-binding protein
VSGVFVDTNVLLYVLSADERKANIAEAVLAKGATISVQVLNEAASVCIRKLKMPWPEVHEFLNGVKACCEVLPLTLSLHEQALVLAERFQLSIYDALVCAAALEGQAHTLLTEDMHEGLVLGNLKFVNPFLNPA